jgi:hypothetical protein
MTRSQDEIKRLADQLDDNDVRTTDLQIIGSNQVKIACMS